MKSTDLRRIFCRIADARDGQMIQLKGGRRMV